MRSTLATIILILLGVHIQAQTSVNAFLQKMPALPKDSCGITRATIESFTKKVSILINDVDEKINALNEKVHAQIPVTESSAKEAALQQMSQYGLSQEEMNKMKSGKMSAAGKQAMANKVLQQQTNMSMGEIQNMSKMSDAGKKAYAEAYATEAQAMTQANPKKPTTNPGANMYQMISEQQAVMTDITTKGQKIGYLYATIDNDPSGMLMLKNIDKWQNQLMSMTGVDYGQGKKMDSLGVLIKNEQIRYCAKFSPQYRSALRQHLPILKSSLPDYQRLGEITAALSKSQTGIEPPPESVETGSLQAIKGYLEKLKDVYKYNLWFPEDN